MIDIAITLVFTMALLMFFVYPSIQIVNFIKKRATISKKVENILILILTISLSLMAALFLKFY